eukprot:scaffold92744_cov69-Phaeocystis_antarctica.AAC.2
MEKTAGPRWRLPAGRAARPTAVAARTDCWPLVSLETIVVDGIDTLVVDGLVVGTFIRSTLCGNITTSEVNLAVGRELLELHRDSQ